MSKTAKIIIIAIVAVVVILVVAKRAGVVGGSSTTKVTAEYSEKRTIVETVAASGKIQPEKDVSISAEVSGEIVELPVIEGQMVEEGDLIVKIRPDIYIAAVNRTEAAVNSARAQLSQSEAQLIESEKNYNRNKELHEKKVISDAEWDRIVSAYQVAVKAVEAAQYQVKSAEATLKEARENLLLTTIYAPMSGTVTALNAELGERVVGTAQMAGTEIMRVSDLRRMEVVVEVNENDIIRVSHGDTAEIEVDAYLGETFKGVVTEIANSANLVSNSADQVTNFEVKIGIIPDSYSHLLKEGEITPFRPGMTATVDIRTRVAEDIVTVPIQAVTLRTDTSRDAVTYRKVDANEDAMEVVFVVGENGNVEIAVVQTGVQDNSYIEITEGLSDSVRVVTGPYNVVSRELKNGQAIEVTEAENVFDNE